MPADSPPPAGQVTASGQRSAAAGTINGPVLTGDSPRVDARTLVLGPGGIPRPADAVITAGMNNLPRPPAGVFVGREAALARLDLGLAGGGSVVVTQAVYGLGGVGKSELALQHAHTRKGSYMLIWWITAEDRSGIEAGLAALAGRICPELALAATTPEAAGWALAWLQAHTGWLLILDDVTEPGDVQALLGQLHGGRILLTTRRDAGWARIAAPVRLDVLDPGPAAALITAATGQGEPGDEQVALEIAGELGFLPLALDQAAAYITQTRIPLARYLALLREHPARMHAATTGGRRSGPSPGCGTSPCRSSAGPPRLLPGCCGCWPATRRTASPAASSAAGTAAPRRRMRRWGCWPPTA